MSQEKSMNKCDVHFKGVGKLMTPIFYQGKIVKIRSDKAYSFIEKEIPYESKIHIEKALNDKAIEKVAAPTEEPADKEKDSKPEGEKK